MSVTIYRTVGKVMTIALFCSTTTLALANDAGKGVTRQALTSSQAFEIAMKTGVANGILIGAEADSMKASTHSNDPTLIDIVKGESRADDCQVFLMTMTQPNVPTRTGANAGNYVAKTKVTLCRDGRQPELAVVGCSVGVFNCLPPR